MTRPLTINGGPGYVRAALTAYDTHRARAHEALAILRSYGDFPRVAGADTAIRLAVRIDAGRTPAEAAAREYCYRWKLALRSPTFGVPHAIGL